MINTNLPFDDFRSQVRKIKTIAKVETSKYAEGSAATTS